MDLVWRIISLASTLLIPAVAWLFRSYFDFHTRLVKIEGRVARDGRRIKEAGLAQAADALRIKESELAIAKLEVTLMANAERSEALVSKLNAIGDRMEMLPRIEESLKHLAGIYEHMVRREEWEISNKAMRDRLSAVERRDAQVEYVSWREKGWPEEKS